MDSTRYLLDIRQSGLGLPDRDYYLDEKFADIRDAYRAHIQRMWALVGLGSGTAAEEAAARVVELETRLAEVHWDKVRNRDPQATYNLTSVDALGELSPGLDLLGFLTEVGVTGRVDEVNVGQPDYLHALGELVAGLPLEDWQDYLRWHAVTATAALLPGEIDRANFEFYGTKLRGIPEQRPRGGSAVSTLCNRPWVRPSARCMSSATSPLRTRHG